MQGLYKNFVVIFKANIQFSFVKSNRWTDEQWSYWLVFA